MTDTKVPKRAEVPAELTGVDDEALAALLTSLTTEFDKLHDEGSRDVATMTALADDIDRVRGEGVLREQAAAQADADIAALAERVRGPEETVDETPEAEPEPESDPEADPPPPVDPEPSEPEEAKKELVTAAARPAARPPLGEVARRIPNKPRVDPKRSAVTITAAVDLPGVSPGTVIDLTQVAQSFHDRARVMSEGQRAPVARVQIPHTHRLGTDPQENVRQIDDLIGQPQAPALVSSGGWCAPSQPIFELFDIGPDVDNIFDLPSLGADVRAGVMVPSFYGIGDVGGALWTWTEAQDIAAATQPAGPEKPCLKIPCPTWTECRMEAEGLCVTHGNLSDRAWPELTKQFLSIVMGAHQRRMSAAKIAKVLTDIGAPLTPDATMLNSDTTGDLLNVIAMAAADMRSQYRIGKRRSVDVLLPDWALDVLRENLAQRAGVWDAMSITDGQVTKWLTDRGVRPQFTPDWQPLYNAAPAVRWPATLTFALWLTGSYFEIDGGEIDLGVVRDSTLNATNDFTAAWSEQFYAVCRRGPKGRAYTVPVLVNGVTGCCPAA